MLYFNKNIITGDTGDILMNPFFSIIIPLYNCERTIALTLESIMNQTCEDYEVIIINDCSDDNTMNIVNKYITRFSYITIIQNESNIGVATSRNKGFSIAKGKYVALLDGDDIWHSDKLEKQKQIIEKTNCDICCTSYSFIDENSNTIKKPYIVPKLIDYKMMLKQNYIGCSAAVIKADLLLYSSMDENYQHEDYALWLKLLREGATIECISEPLMKYRILKSSRSFSKTKAAKGRMIIYLKQEGLGLIKSVYYFLCYAFNGIKKKLL